MKYQIDQSGKVESTNKPTYVALANGKTIIIKISAIEKQKLIEIMGDIARPHKHTYAYRIFASLVFILIQEKSVTEVLIDTEYSGHNASIKEIILQLFEKLGFKAPEINFGFVGKQSSAHKAAISSFRKKVKPDLVVTAEKIVELLYGRPKEKGWRSRSGRENP